ncbi:MAG TPA: hydantoinase/oxoprolinase family protein [Actinomycetota bacterium]|nr:hydantoinase/oxoprolinase family protein [Actinomycetota bacterium]
MRIGVDVGGTFTDGVAVDEGGRVVGHRKEPSTPPAIEEGALVVVAALAGGARPDLVVHGTTVATNALIERGYARVGLLTTEGFRDVLAIGSMQRPDLYDVWQTKPDPIVPRRLRFEVPERVAPDGGVLRPLDEVAVARAARRLGRERVEAVAVCFLFSYANPAHERRAGAILRQLLPGVEVALSSEVAPIMREFPRTSTTAVNAALRPVVARYLRGFGRRARASVLVMQSNGGVVPAREAARRAHELLVSGPAGGVVGATAFAAARGVRDLVTMDMGGTSFDTCLVLDGRPRVRGGSEVAGWPILAPAVDLVTVGAGGGSLARVDAGGALRVGPRSAGAIPGPACYGRGGTHPTVTDANLLIGRLDPERFLEGRLPLDLEAAARAVHDHVARPLGIPLEAAAHAVVEVASATMARALRVVTVGRGRDPADLPLVAFGGAGPLHAARLAEELGSPRVLVPPLPGFVSALGLLATELRTEAAETVLAAGRGAPGTASLERTAARLSRIARRRLGEDTAAVALAVDLRYEGQGYELTVPLEDTTPAAIARAERAFHALHDAVYGHAAPEEPVEVVALRATASAPGAGFVPRPIPERPAPAPTTVTKVWDGAAWVETPAFDRTDLPPGWETRGPVLVLEGECTTWVPAGWAVAVDPWGTLEVSRARR